MGARITPKRHFIFTKDSVFLPFLYRTRTLTVPCRQSPNFRPAHHRPGYEQPRCYSTHSTTNNSSETSDLCEEHPSNEQDDAQPRKSYLALVRARRANNSEPALAKRDGGSQSQSTITSSENKLFQRLLKTSGPDDSPKLTRIVQTISRKNPRTSTRSLYKVKPFIDQAEKEEVVDVSRIMDRSLKKFQGNRKRAWRRKGEDVDDDDDDSLGPLPPFKDPNDRRYGSARTRLEKVYAKLKRFETSSIDSPYETGPLAGLNPFPIAYFTAQREANKICNEMDDAVAAGKGDLGVWKICEDRVFGMLDLVPREQSHPSDDKANDESDSSSNNATEESKVEKPTHNHTHSPSQLAKLAQIGLEIPPDVPILDVVRHVYPQVLIHAMRIFHTHFPVSHFVTQLPETAKSHGRFSRLAGASTDFYNEQMAFVWGFYSDIPRVVAFLGEMEVTGVPFDPVTLRLMEDIRTQWEAAKADTDEKRGDGRYVGNTWWWDTPAAVKAYRSLVEGTEENPSWIKKIKTQIRKDLTTRRRRMKYTERYIKEQMPRR